MALAAPGAQAQLRSAFWRQTGDWHFLSARAYALPGDSLLLALQLDRELTAADGQGSWHVVMEAYAEGHLSEPALPDTLVLRQATRKALAKAPERAHFIARLPRPIPASGQLFLRVNGPGEVRYRQILALPPALPQGYPSLLEEPPWPVMVLRQPGGRRYRWVHRHEGFRLQGHTFSPLPSEPFAEPSPGAAERLEDILGEPARALDPAGFEPRPSELVIATHAGHERTPPLGLYTAQKGFYGERDYASLIPPLGYLTTHGGYRKLSKAEDKREAFEQFWLKRGVGKATARDLIRVYYQRVQTANRLFTSYKPGWMTERGMLLILMGWPDAITWRPDRRLWFYEFAPGTDSPLYMDLLAVYEAFVPLPHNLRRRRGFRYFWDNLQEAWQNGSILSPRR